MARFRHIKGLPLTPFTPEEDAAADAAEEAEAIRQLDDIADAAMTNRGAIKAVALTMLAEINILRTQAGLNERTVAQLKTAVRNNAT